MNKSKLLVICAGSATLFSQIAYSNTTGNTEQVFYLSSAAPQLKDDFHLNVTGEFLWWKVAEPGSNTDVFVNVEPIIGADLFRLDSSGTAYAKFHWDPGFRVGIGYTIPRDSSNSTRGDPVL